jgi:hypothetical protein
MSDLKDMSSAQGLCRRIGPDQEISGIRRLLKHIGLGEGCYKRQTSGHQDHKIPRC